MAKAICSPTPESDLPASLAEADATLAALPSCLERQDRMILALDSAALFNGAEFPGFFDAMSDYAAREICDHQPKIVWG